MGKANGLIVSCLYGSGGQEGSELEMISRPYGDETYEPKQITTNLSQSNDPSTTTLVFGFVCLF